MLTEKSQKDRKPIAVGIFDVHYSLNTLDLAHAAYAAALKKAEDLNVPFVDFGDTLDTKANLRAECVKDLISLLENTRARVIILVGNHTMVSEKGTEHALHFLYQYAEVVSTPVFDTQLNSWLIPYHNDAATLQKVLDTVPQGSRLFMHQGVQGADLGHYIQDKTSLPKESFADFRVISGHYHKRQNIKCGRPRKGGVGLFTYGGNPYTLNFGEADHGPKGYSIIFDDGMTELVPLDLPSHSVLELTTQELNIGTQLPQVSANIKLWVKVTGPKLELDRLDKSALGARLGVGAYKLDKIPMADLPEASEEGLHTPSTQAELLDRLIDSTSEAEDDKKALKALWRELCA